MTAFSRINLPEIIRGDDPTHIVSVLRDWKSHLQGHADFLDRVVPFSGHYESSTATATGSYDLGWHTTNAATPRFVIPANYELHIQTAAISVTAGATSGSYLVQPVVKDERSPNVYYELGNPALFLNGETKRTTSVGRMSDPLATIPEGAEITIGWENTADSAGALAASAHKLIVCGMLVPTT